jgi:hypothetical protein
VPHHAGAAIALGLRGRDGGLHGAPDRVELVIAGELLHDAVVVGLVDDEVAQEIEEAPLLEDPAQHHLELGHRGRRELFTLDGAPRRVALAVRGDRADARVDAVGDQQERVEHEERRQLVLVGLQLVEGRPDRGLFVGRVLQLDERERQPIDEDDHVGPARVALLLHRELVHDEPVVGAWLLEVDDAHRRVTHGAVGTQVFEAQTVDQVGVELAVAVDELRRRDARQLAEGLVERLLRQLRIEPRQRAAQPPFENDLLVARALRPRLTRRDRRPVRDRVSELREPLEAGFLDGVFVHGWVTPANARRAGQDGRSASYGIRRTRCTPC